MGPIYASPGTRGINDLQEKLLADLRSNSRGRSTTNNPDVPLLEAVVGAADAEEHESEEDDGAHNQKDLKLSERLQCRDWIFRESARLLLSERCSKKQNAEEMRLTGVVPGRWEQGPGAQGSCR